MVRLFAGSQGEHPERHLGGFRGFLQADGHAAFNHIYEKGGTQAAGCWGHVRRKFFDLQQARASASAA